MNLTVKDLKKKFKFIDGGKNRSIAVKMLVLMIAFIFIIFAAIFISFNLSVGGYIDRETNGQITKALNDVRNIPFTLESEAVGIVGNKIIKIAELTAELTKEQVQELSANPLFYNKFYRDVVYSLRTSNANSEVNIALYNNSDYVRLYPDERYNLFQDLNEIDSLISNIKLNNFTAPNIAYRTSTSYGSYYLTLVDLNDLYGLPGLSVAIYINTAKYDLLAGSINMMLLIILIIATIFSFGYVLFISRNITKPIQDLCHFADEIGRGNFKRAEYEFRDREFIDLNNRMNETARKLEKNDEDQKMFFQNVSHELKTPLMSVKGYAEGIKYNVFSSEKQREEAADIIISETDRLNDLVSDLLYISKLDLLKKAENKTRVNFCELVGSCVEKLSGLVINSDKKININKTAEEIYIECDESSLIRAILNVMANCVQYAKSSVEVSVYADYPSDSNYSNHFRPFNRFNHSGHSTAEIERIGSEKHKELAESSKFAVLSVHDDGGGIAESDLPNIFKRFYKGAKGKHGIGLAITKAIVEQHGGEITAGNRDGGAEFLFRFKAV